MAAAPAALLWQLQSVVLIWCLKWLQVIISHTLTSSNETSCQAEATKTNEFANGVKKKSISINKALHWLYEVAIDSLNLIKWNKGNCTHCNKLEWFKAFKLFSGNGINLMFPVLFSWTFKSLIHVQGFAFRLVFFFSEDMTSRVKVTANICLVDVVPNHL